MRCLKLILLISLLSGCRTFEIGFVQTPTATAALPLRATTTPTVTATSASAATPTALVPPTSTATLPPPATAKPIVIRPTQPIEPTPTATALPTAAPDPPTIISFSIEPREVNPGETVTLRWSVTNADSIDIYQYTPDTLPAYDTLGLPVSGALTQTILERERLWHVYELAAPHGSRVVTQTVSVAIRCPYTYFFNPLPVEDRAEWSCPESAPSASTAAEQVFENGRMIWLQHDDRIYVFFNDGKYQTFEDTWVAGQAETVPGLTPPSGRYAPVRGFGKVWSGAEDVRSRLGWALAAEQGFEAQLQGGWIHCCSRLGTVNRPIYLRNIEGRILRLWPGEMPPGQWQFVTP
jgi:hypothetical protein